MKHFLQQNWLVIFSATCFFLGLFLEIQSGKIDGAVLVPIPIFILALMLREPKQSTRARRETGERRFEGNNNVYARGNRRNA